MASPGIVVLWKWQELPESQLAQQVSTIALQLKPAVIVRRQAFQHFVNAPDGRFVLKNAESGQRGWAVYIAFN
jgi:hypothetical protein